VLNLTATITGKSCWLQTVNRNVSEKADEASFGDCELDVLTPKEITMAITRNKSLQRTRDPWARSYADRCHDGKWLDLMSHTSERDFVVEVVVAAAATAARATP